jgi:hypothetical protein
MNPPVCWVSWPEGSAIAPQGQVGQEMNPDILRAANINPVTGLATDYLNHFNEVAMMIGLLADMPDMADAVLDWAPLDYASHFRNTGFREKDLAIAAYESAPSTIRNRFDAMREAIDLEILELQDRLRAQPERVEDLPERSRELCDRIAELGGVINAGSAEDESNAAQDEVDSLFS